jgi:hypothetical protein
VARDECRRKPAERARDERVPVRARREEAGEDARARCGSERVADTHQKKKERKRPHSSFDSAGRSRCTSRSFAPNSEIEVCS